MSLTDSFAGIPSGSRILLAFSGGIDSSVAAYLCRKAGFQVIPAYLQLIPGSGDPEKMNRIQQVADALELGKVQFIPLQDEFRKTVMRPCWDDFAKGRTPNPCALCNPAFKFGRLLEYALAGGCDYMATGHYARLDGTSLYRGADRTKDQSYFLFGLTPEQLSRVCFPLGSLCKSEVRAMAQELALPNASDPESQDICFAQGTEHLAEYLRNLFGESMPEGCFRDMQGKVLGRHRGIHTFTPGQRKGTGVAMGVPAYVQSVKAENNDVILTTDNADLMQSVLQVRDLHYSGSGMEFRAEVQIRYRGRPAAAMVRLTGQGTAEVIFDSPQRAVTPGQAAVFYEGDHLLGGGWIA